MEIDARARVAARFAAKVRSDGEHQIWTGGASNGLGVFKLNGRPEKAPRVAWLLANGVLPDRPLERTCAVPGCVAPEHHRQRPTSPAGRRRALPRGSGHLRQRSPGSFTVEVVTGTDPLDRRRKVRESFTVRGTFEDAKAAAEEFRARARIGDRINLAAKGTFGELLELWLEHARLARSTRKTYQGYIDNHIRPALGGIPLRELSTFDLDRFYTALAERGGKCRHCWWRVRNGQPPLGRGERYQPRPSEPERIHTVDCTQGRMCRHCQQRVRAGGPPLGPGARYQPRPRARERIHDTDCVRGLPLEPATERQVHAIVHRALAQAKKWKLITTNPADDTTRSSVPVPEVDAPPAHAVARLLNAAFADDRQLGVLTWMAMITQGRRGEAIGIRWSAVHFETAELVIAGTVEGDRAWKPYPKNTKGRRIRLDPVTLAMLADERQAQEAHAARFGTELRADAFVFAHPLTPDGAEPIDPNLLSKRFHRLCQRLGVTIYRNLYGLRHFGASDLVRAGVDVRTVAGRLGNDPAVTLRRYAHFAADADLAAVTGLAERMAAFMAELEQPSEHVETCRHGHPWTEDNTYRNPATGARMCRECARDRHRRRLRIVSDAEESA